MTFKIDSDEVIRDIEIKRRDFTGVYLEFAAEKWWVQFQKGEIKSVPAVDKDLYTAYIQALANWEEASKALIIRHAFPSPS